MLKNKQTPGHTIPEGRTLWVANFNQKFPKGIETQGRGYSFMV